MKNRIKSFGYAAKGIKAALKSEINMKIHLLIAVLVVICGILFS
jgi:diacylglycerol kinase